MQFPSIERAAQPRYVYLPSATALRQAGAARPGLDTAQIGVVVELSPEAKAGAGKSGLGKTVVGNPGLGKTAPAADLAGAGDKRTTAGTASDLQKPSDTKKSNAGSGIRGKDGKPDP